MAGPEKKIENQIKRYLDKLGAYYLKVHGSVFQPAGTPDILACVNGRFVAIEVKRANGGVVSELQKAKLKRIKNSGGVAIVARSVEDVSKMLKYENVV
ncbi:VRR-NUC domain-containing protein [Enterococcus cecorum]|uniref:VRR-NUC domain-containing protein n=1 Tax=Enterococcus cecorum TaxID=44008 RepID=UPI001FAD1040|nr:VRR-NUC domain-containing protein [Enterococcus cecorum]MCJ0572363.1 VRR-NUC domain-containing protein [Enterococcus cecorum]MCJ0577213.1 VRR-NUC domain-containing protein [Enterococcus cecorum]MCJ0584258.1 VRR-NUC domain-containing protein [Enterococcus cecorum]MCJ0589577.1 VRR-NUC domain-containing protein [Enterococcus cecorum]